jgi:GTP-binding protein EngB required for normal cell division
MEGDEFAGNFYSNLRSLVTLIDHLRDAGLQNYIRLPRIVTLGVQSSGKSSVLESIVGLNFLPRNEGVCTRRPLELRLVHVTENIKPYAVFEGVSEKFTNFDKVRDMIVKLTEDKAGKTKNIIDDPIILTIFSPTCPDLTLIDLPGITRIAVGDQPKNIYEITKEMAHRYISDPRTIILCVCAANVDVTTSDGLLMAQRVDKAGIRTLGVITKIDIMDRGTNAKNTILNKEVQLKLGFVGVKNRSQEDINNLVRVEAALQEERDYFSKHEIYSTMPPGYLGTEVLTKKLTQVLFTHIRNFLPEIIREIIIRIKDADDRLRELGPSAPIDMKSKLQLLWNMVTDFCELFKNTIRGKFDKRGNSRVTKDLAGGAHIKVTFNNLLGDFAGDYKATGDYSDDDIRKAISMHEGDSMPGFPSVDVFIYLMQSQLEKLRGPVLDCLTEVHGYLENLAHTIINRVFSRFPALIGEMNELATFVLARERETTREIVESMITAEEGYIFTNDLEYLSSRTDIIPKSDPKAPAQAKSAEMIFVNEIRSRIDSYFKLVVRNVRDSVPKVIGYFLVRTIMDKLQLELYEQINHSESIINRLSEPPTIAAERESLKKQLETLRKAEKILKHNPEFARQTDNIAKELEEQEANYKREQEEKKSGKKEEKKEVREERVHVEEKKKEEPQAPPEKPAENKMFTSQASPPEKNMFGAAKPEVKAAGMFGPTIAKTGSNFFAGK